MLGQVPRGELFGIVVDAVLFTGRMPFPFLLPIQQHQALKEAVISVAVTQGEVRVLNEPCADGN